MKKTFPLSPSVKAVGSECGAFFSMARSLRLIWDVCEFNGVKGREGISENGDVLIGGHIRRSSLCSAYLWLRTPSASAIPRPIFMAEAVSSSRRRRCSQQPSSPSVGCFSFAPSSAAFSIAVLASETESGIDSRAATAIRGKRYSFDGNGRKKGREDSIDEGTERFGYSSLGGFPSSLVNDAGTSVITSGK